MESGALNTAVGQGGIVAMLVEKVNPTEAFIILLVMFLSFGLWKMWTEIKQLLLDREHTAEKRNLEISQLQNSVTELKGMVNSHFQIHLEIDKKLERAEELRDKVTCINAKLALLLESNIRKPTLPK